MVWLLLGRSHWPLTTQSFVWGKLNITASDKDASMLFHLTYFYTKCAFLHDTLHTSQTLHQNLCKELKTNHEWLFQHDCYDLLDRIWHHIHMRVQLEVEHSPESNGSSNSTLTPTILPLSEYEA